MAKTGRIDVILTKHAIEELQGTAEVVVSSIRQMNRLRPSREQPGAGKERTADCRWMKKPDAKLRSRLVAYSPRMLGSTGSTSKRNWAS